MASPEQSSPVSSNLDTKVTAPVIPDASTPSSQQPIVVATPAGTLTKMAPPERAAPLIDAARTTDPELRQPHRRYQLLGTTLAPNGDSALLRDPSNEEHWTVHAGDRIDDASVTEIRADRVVLTSTQGSELLLFATRDSPRVVQPPAAGVASSAASGNTVPVLPGSTAPAQSNITPGPTAEAAPPTSGTLLPIPQYTGADGETPTYVEPADAEQVRGH
jgi:hypothetical protein